MGILDHTQRCAYPTCSQTTCIANCHYIGIIRDQVSAMQAKVMATINVIIPYLMPLVTFVALIQLMDNFRVFEPIVGFNAGAHATSLSWAIFNDLGGETRQLSSAAATSVMTIIGVAILLTPVLIRTWRDFKVKT